MQHLLLCVASAGLTLAGLTLAAQPTPGAGVPLFDGRTFEGWEGDTKKTWRIVDGALVGGSLTETMLRNDFLVTTRQYRDFVLRLQFKLVGTGFVNGGVQFRSQRLDKPAYEMIGYQADLGDDYWGSLYDESRRNKVMAAADPDLIKTVLKRDDWNDYEVRCEGRRIRLSVNGRLTIDYTEADPTIPQDGFVGLQIHGGGKAEAAYRNITIEELR